MARQRVSPTASGTRINPSRFPIRAISSAAPIHISVSISTPNAFSIRSDLSPDSPAFPFSTLSQRESLRIAPDAVRGQAAPNTRAVL